MRVAIRTSSATWEVVEGQQELPDDASNAVFAVARIINSGGLLKCRMAQGDGKERWVVIAPAGLEYIAGE
jgi:hypothetical protein